MAENAKWWPCHPRKVKRRWHRHGSSDKACENYSSRSHYKVKIENPKKSVRFSSARVCVGGECARWVCTMRTFCWVCVSVPAIAGCGSLLHFFLIHNVCDIKRWEPEQRYNSDYATKWHFATGKAFGRQTNSLCGEINAKWLRSVWVAPNLNAFFPWATRGRQRLRG